MGNRGQRAGPPGLHSAPFAAQEYQADAARALLVAGASTTVRDVHGNTPLSTATFNSRGGGELIEELPAHGADPDSVNSFGVSPRTLAATIANSDVAQIFEDIA